MFFDRRRPVGTPRERVVAIWIAIATFALMAFGEHLVPICFGLGLLALPGCLTRAIRYRASFDILMLAADCGLLLGLAAQIWGESIFGITDLGILAVCYVGAFILSLLTIIEIRHVRADDLRLRLDGLSDRDRFLYWCGFASLGRSPAVVRQEAEHLTRARGLKAELRYQRSSNLILGLVIIGTLLPGLWLCGFSKDIRAGGKSIGVFFLLGLLAMLSGLGYAYWLWRISRRRHHVPDNYYKMRCVNCGYDLRGLPERRCPECGLAF